MIRILFLINTLRGGGAEKVLVDLINNMPHDVYDITIHTIDNTGVYLDHLSKDVKYKTINRKKGFIRWFFNHILTFNLPAKRIYKKYINDNYDIEIAFLEGLPTKIIAASTNKTAKKIAWVHTDLMRYFESAVVYKNYEENRKSYQCFDKIACVSEDVKQKFIERFGDIGDKVQTVYNIVLDDEIRDKGMEDLGDFKHDYPIIVGCGRLCEQKGFDRLLRIHKRMLDENIKHYLWIVGDGDLRPQLEEYIKANNLLNTVTLLGFQLNPYKYIKNADLFICSSIAEGYSTVVTESAVLGTPIISTDVAGSKEPYEYPRCFKVVENNEESLFVAIKQVLVDKVQLSKAREYTKKAADYLKKEILLQKLIKFIGD